MSDDESKLGIVLRYSKLQRLSLHIKPESMQAIQVPSTVILAMPLKSDTVFCGFQIYLHASVQPATCDLTSHYMVINLASNN